MEDNTRIGSMDKDFKFDDLSVLKIMLADDTGFVALKWDKDKKELQVECDNATIEEGAQGFFEYLKGYFGAWIVEQLDDKADTCQYCGR